MGKKSLTHHEVSPQGKPLTYLIRLYIYILWLFIFVLNIYVFELTSPKLISIYFYLFSSINSLMGLTSFLFFSEAFPLLFTVSAGHSSASISDSSSTHSSIISKATTSRDPTQRSISSKVPTHWIVVDHVPCFAMNQ